MFNYHLTIQISKKFLKKNVLLHQNLESFLRCEKETTKFNPTSSLRLKTLKSSLKKKDIKKLFKRQNFLSQKNEEPFIQNPKNLNLYKPLSWLKMEEMLNYNIFQSTFFPSKKPFMQFWIFPLLGACFLSLVTSAKPELTKTKSNLYTVDCSVLPLVNNQRLNSRQKSSIFSQTSSALPYFTNSLTENLSTLNSQNFQDTKHTPITQPLSNFLGNYPKSNLKHKKITEKSLNQDLQDLCLFYLNLTTKNLDTSTGTTFSNFNNSDMFFEKNLLQPLYIEKSNFQWIWYPLQKQFNLSFSPNNKFTNYFLPEKIEHFEFLQNNAKPMKIVFEQKPNVNLTSKIPTLSYKQAAKIFERWLTNLELDFAFDNLRQNQTLKSQEFQTIKNVVKSLPKGSEDFLETLEKLIILEKLNLEVGKNNNQLVLNFKNFLEFLDRNEKELNNIFLNIKPMKDKLSLNDSHTLENNPDNWVESTKIKKLNSFFKNFENSLNKDFKKILLQNYLQKQTDKNVFQKKFSSSLLINNLNAKNKKLDNSFKNSITTQQKMNFNPIFTSTRFLNSSKLSSLLRSNLQNLHLDEKFEKTNSSFIEQPKENYFILFENWKNLLKAKSFYLLDKNPGKIQMIKSQFPKTFTNLSQNNLVQEIYLYRQFDKICEKLFNLVLFTNKTDNNTSYNFKNSNKKEILNYTSPILFSSLEKDTSDILKTFDLNKGNLSGLSLQTRMKETWLENEPKQSYFQNTFSLVQSFFVPFRSENEASLTLITLKNSKLENSEPKQSFLKTFLSVLHNVNKEKNQKLNLNFLPTFQYGKLNQLATLDEQSKTKMLNQFSMAKKYETLDNKKVYSMSFNSTKSKLNLTNLKLKENGHYLSSAIPKGYKQKVRKFNKGKEYKSSLLQSKGEKLFRAYSSVKALKDKQKKSLEFSTKSSLSAGLYNLRTNKSTFQKVRPIFEKLKNKVKMKNFVFNNVSQKRFSVYSSRKESNFKTNKFLKISEVSVNKNNKNLASLLTSSNLEKLYFKNRKNKMVESSRPISQSFLTNLGSFNYLKKADFLQNETDLTRFEKKKSLEKKRRLKKLKLENRRRKKRKRFYPRPNYLRFNLYSQFLQKRYFNKFNGSETLSTKNGFVQKVKTKQKFSTENPSILLKQKIYHQQTKAWGNSLSNNLGNEKTSLKQFSNLLTKPLYHQKEFYKISNETLTEFERLCWKSYWLRSNLKPYIRRIQQNLKNMQKFETFKNSDGLFSNFGKDFTAQIQPFSFTENTSLYSNRRQILKNVAPFYLNIHESLTTSSGQNLINSPFIKKFENNAEYERLLYDRITEEIKNVKSQLNVDGQTQPRSYKVGRQKIQKPTPKMLFESFYSLQNNYFEPNIQGIALNSSTIKPFGDLPTLRVLWACHKTNLFTYKENNYSKQIWTLYKQREQTKNNKTKKFVSKVFKFSPFRSKNMQSLSASKTKFATKKVQLFGGFIYGQNYQTYLRNLKFKLQKTPSLKTKLQPENSISLIFGCESNIQATEKNKETKQWFETNLENKLQKRVIHFWWSSQKPSIIENKVPFFMFSPFIFSNFSEYISDNSNKLTTNNNFLNQNSNTRVSKANLEFPENLSQKDKFNLVLDNTLITPTFWIACCLFHLAIFFTIIRIPEIRSLLKFQFLVLSKLANVYLIGLFSIYDLLKNYQTKLKLLVQKTFSFSKSTDNDFYKKSFTTFTTKRKLNLNFQKAVVEANGFNMSTNQISGLNLNNRNSMNFRSTTTKKFKTVKPLQSTLTFAFYSRNIFNFVDLKNKTKYGSTEKFNKVNSFLRSSIHPAFGSSMNKELFAKFEKTKEPFIKNTSIRQNQKVGAAQVSTKIVFDSWYTGFLWYRFDKILNKQKLLKVKEKYFKEFKQDLASFAGSLVHDVNKQRLREQSSQKKIKSNLQIQFVLSLVVLSMTKLTVQIFYTTLGFLYKILLTGIDIMESILLLFYKFLEKPAELMVAWIADIFLIEWSSDMTTYIPEAFDRDIFQSLKKVSRSTRFMGGLPFGFFLQRMILNSTEIFYSWLVKPDADLLTRQKKGVIFWDIWAEILIQAAETYKMNLSSLNSVKEEQELLIENLLEEKQIVKVLHDVDKQKKDKTKTTQTNLTGIENSKTFLNSKVFKDSLTKMEPLTKFLQEFPTNPVLRINASKISPEMSNTLRLSTKITEENFVLFSNPIKMEDNYSVNLFKANTTVDTSKRWAVNQYLTTQGRDTDLFMDIHPPKSFAHIRFLKTYLPAQEILSSIVCDIYAGLFPQRVSKNILIVGAPGSTKGFFIQALAGETELKIVTDNAHRYAFVNGGVPIGMKLLRDVFDSLALHTPCLFLLEDIHIIGERRPMLISDDELSKTKDFTFGAEQEEVHEKNRLLYQFSRHALSHYKKPYKGDFSASIPTNHFSYDLFLGVQPPRKRASDLTPKSPLSISRIEKVLTSQEGMDANNVENQKSNKKQNNLSFLQLSMEQFFAPPATSPFTILLMKEQKKLKPKKVVKEMPWSGLSYDQFMLISKSQYSVRVKVALLAETAMTNLSLKLDMITDLLVIIDSVRSNRGFVVFATTHLPALLDPALRRPGRFDETLSLPLLPNLMTRFEIFKTSLSSYTKTTDFFDLSLFTSKQKQNENEISLSLSKALLLLLNTKNLKQRNIEANLLNFPVFSNFFNDYSIYSISQAFQTTISENSLLLNTNKFKHIVKLNFEQSTVKENRSQMKTLLSSQNFEKNSKQSLCHLLRLKSSNVGFAGNDKLNYISLSYGQAGQFLVESLITRDFKTYSTKFLMSNNPMDEFDNYEQSVFQTLYSSNIETKNTLLKLFASKISEFFVLNNSNTYLHDVHNQNQSLLSKEDKESNLSKAKKEKLFLARKNRWFSEENFLQTNPSQSALFDNVENFQGYWQSALSFLDGLSQKRYLYNKNSIVSKMLFFEDNMSLREAPSPPNSSILMPAKKFENYKRTLKDFIQKPTSTIQEKLQIHQKQRFLKLLYNVPVQTSFPTFSNFKEHSLNNKNKMLPSTNFYTSFKELGYLDLITLKPTSSYLIYKNRFLTRHRFSFLNQWWNGQLAEHNVETTYLSHVDWRSMFVQSLGDLVIDFPDADQYYNPKQRRWYLHSSSWAYWLDFEKAHRTEISQHSILQCFTKTSHLLNENRELFDYLAFRFLRYHQLKEFDLVQTLVRFYKIEEC